MHATRNILFLVLVACILALTVALSAEHFMGILPCQLCGYQRIPFAVAGMFAILGLAYPLIRRYILIICTIVFVGSVALAGYHVGVQKQWWNYSPTCASDLMTDVTTEDLMAQLSKPVKVQPCDKVDWDFMGISMAGYNFLYSLALVIVLCGRFHLRKKL